MSLSFEDAQDLIDRPRIRNKGWCKVANNTYLERLRDDLYAVRLHNTYIVYIHDDGTYTLNSGGWTTPTTMERMRDILPRPVNLWSSGPKRSQKGWRIVGICDTCHGRWRCQTCHSRKKRCPQCNGQRALDMPSMGLSGAFAATSGERAWVTTGWHRKVLSPNTKVQDKEKSSEWVYCGECGGSGVDPDYECPECGGSGRRTPPCPECGSKGDVTWQVPFFDGIRVDGNTGEVLNSDDAGDYAPETFSGFHGHGYGRDSLDIPECRAWYEDALLISRLLTD